MYILQCLDIIRKLIINQMEVVTLRYYQAKIFININKDDTFPARVLNIFIDYLLGQMRVGDKLWMNWNEHPM